MKKRNSGILALGGIAGPVLFSMTTLICGGLRPGYDHVANFISELGATGTSNENLMNYAGFIPSGILITLFGISLFLLLPAQLISRTGSVFLSIFGIGMVLAGIFSCDPGCPPQGSFESIIHDRVSAVTFISAILGILFVGLSFRKIGPFGKLWRYSILSGCLSAMLLALMINSFESKSLTGMWQRLLLFSIFQWTAVVGLTLFKRYHKLTILPGS
jgi:hypothetical membrane protein